jgi:hypothetical protein
MTANNFSEKGLQYLLEFHNKRQENQKLSLETMTAGQRECYLTFHSVLLNMLHDGSGMLVHDPNADTHYQMALIANIAMLVDATYQLITDGLYSGAATLIRQSFEMAARIIEIQEGHKWKDGDVPNVKHLPYDLRRQYSGLSDLAHFGKLEINELTIVKLKNGKRAQSISPMFQRPLFTQLINLHIGVLWITCMQQREFFTRYTDIDVTKYATHLYRAWQLLLEEGIIKERGDD